MIMLRASYEGSNGGEMWTVDPDAVGDSGSFRFLSSFLNELALVYLLWHPLLATIYFSGAIWGVFPCIGGRPKEIKLQKDEAKRMHESSSRSEKFNDDYV